MFFGKRGKAAAKGAPASPIEAAVSRIWCEVLGVDSVGVNDDFLALGGHSLSAIRVLSRILADFHVDIPFSAFMSDPTISSTAALIVTRLAESAGAEDVERALREVEGDGK